jgi:putative nucleotidyltransferase with HDIG domain
MSGWVENKQADAAAEIVKTLRDAGYLAYFAGGCVRDHLLGRIAADYDVATNARPVAVLSMFPKTFAVGAHFGVVLVVSELAGKEVMTEVATFRNDGAYSDGRHPDAVRFSESAEEDVQRRDFTINGMLLDPVSLEVLDFVGGRTDLDAKLVRAIGDPLRRFEEDKLRMLRAVRFAARFGFSIEPATLAAIQKLAPKIDQVSRERIREELTKMLTEGKASDAFRLLDATGLLVQVLPEISKMQGVAQPPEFHPEGDVWVHTLLLLEKLELGCSPTLAWGTLLHDVGKPPTYREAPDRIRFDGHAEVGTRMAEAILKRLRFSNEECEQIALLVKNHMRFGDVMEMKDSTLKRFFRLPKFEEHLALHRMDCLSSHRLLRLYDYAKERYERMPAEQVRPVLLVTGADLIAEGYAPGPRFKQMLAAAEDAQLEGLIVTREEGLSLVRDRFGSI